MILLFQARATWPTELSTPVASESPRHASAGPECLASTGEHGGLPQLPVERRPNLKAQQMITRRNLLRSLVTTITLFAATQGTAQSVIARGQISRTLYSAIGSVQMREKFNFEFQVSEGCWFAETKPLDPASPDESIVTACDGTNVFTLVRQKRIVPGIPKHSWPTALEKQVSKDFLDMIERGHTNTRPNGELFCREGNIPQVEPGLVAPLWLAFGSAAYFEMQGGVTSAPCLWLPVGHSNSRTSTVIARGSTARGNGGLPTHLVFGPFLSSLSGVNVADFERDESRSDLATAEYTVLASTNLAGTILPTRFALVRFLSDRTNSKGTRAVRSEVNGMVTDVAITHTNSFGMPSPESGFTVVEQRLPKDVPLALFKYIAKDGRLWSLYEVTNSAKFKGELLKATKARSGLKDANRQTRRQTVIWRSALLATLVAPVLVLWLYTRARVLRSADARQRGAVRDHS